jgi:hypothetical protein
MSLLANSQGYNAADTSGLSTCYATAAETDPSGNSQVYVTVAAGYRHPLFLPIISSVLDGIDGTNDNALRIGTKAEFRVEQDGSVNIGGPVCAP